MSAIPTGIMGQDPPVSNASAPAGPRPDDLRKQPEQPGLFGDIAPVPLPPPDTLDQPDPEPEAPPSAVVITAATVAPATAPPGLVAGVDLFGNPVQAARPKGALSDKFLFSPFSVLNAREGAWQERKREWVSLGLKADDGTRDGVLGVNSAARSMAKFNGVEVSKALDASTSIFDPVLCELVYRWFCPPSGAVLDPFAGESTKGIVAGVLGYGYTGCELRADQVAANRAQAAAIGVTPTWVNGDSAAIGSLLPPDARYDMIWTSPPYFDLEMYTDDAAKDGSAFASYELFMEWYELIFAQCINRLRPNRFLAVKVGEIRDARGVYRNFVGDNIACFERLGLHYYNEIILVTSVGSLPIRTGKQFNAGRKIGKTHQNVLAFWKGNPDNINAAIKREFGPVATLPE